jgi:hypothetical protein
MRFQKILNISILVRRIIKFIINMISTWMNHDILGKRQKIIIVVRIRGSIIIEKGLRR